MSTDDGLSGRVVQVGSTWRRNPPGREVVRVERVWVYDGETLVRAHPTRGGKPLVASVEYLCEHYAYLRAAAYRGGKS